MQNEAEKKGGYLAMTQEEMDFDQPRLYQNHDRWLS